MTILEAAQNLNGQKSVKFIFVGEGAFKNRLIQYRNKQNIENVDFYSAVEKSRMPSVWSLCDIVLIPLKNDALFSTVVPSKLYEAMAMGKVILLMSPEGEASRILREHEAGVHITSESPAELTKTIRILMENPDKMKTLSQNAIEAAKLYTRERQASSFIKTIELAQQPPSFEPLRH